MHTTRNNKIDRIYSYKFSEIFYIAGEDFASLVLFCYAAHGINLLWPFYSLVQIIPKALHSD